MPARAKTFTYAAELERGGRIRVAGGGAVDLDEAWSPDDLLLAALARCTIQSLRFHAARAGLDAVGSAEARGVVTRRDEDGRYAFVEIECSLDVELEAMPAEEDLRELLAKAERDCFVGASLTVAPRYRWRVNGNVVE